MTNQMALDLPEIKEYPLVHTGHIYADSADRYGHRCRIATPFGGDGWGRVEFEDSATVVTHRDRVTDLAQGEAS